MAKRRGKAKARRRTNKSINLLNVAESVANLATTTLLGVNVRDFFLAGTTFSNKYSSGYQSGGQGTGNHNYQITLNEILRGSQYPSKGANPVGFGTAITKNAKDNAMTLIGGAILIPIGFNLVKKITSKPRAQTNRLLKNIGIKELRV